MYIHEAIAASKLVSEDKYALPYIRRKGWPYCPPMTSNNRTSVKIRPSNGPDRCIVLSNTSDGARAGWQPTMDDLMADDWETCL